MITEIVTFDLPKGITRADTMDKYRQTAPAWSQNTDLVQKHYFFDEARSLGGGVYIWKTMQAAEKWHGKEYMQKIRDLYGSDVTMRRFDTLLVVDNVSGEVIELEPDSAL